mmetsp:Transcript_4401/g.6131  ORF Transcript_4401/g.6131 Transcript_4401/m.6131 type:complete len:87 (+) Transcript_4401:198-458(+)
MQNSSAATSYLNSKNTTALTSPKLGSTIDFHIKATCINEIRHIRDWRCIKVKLTYGVQSSSSSSKKFALVVTGPTAAPKSSSSESS